MKDKIQVKNNEEKTAIKRNKVKKRKNKKNL